MKKNIFGRKFKRDANERKALFKNFLTSLVLEERIKTTPAKAKAIKAAADKLVTKAKKGGEEAMRSLAPDVNHNAVVKLVEDIAPRFATRQGGYTRILNVGRRIADNAPQAIMEWVEKSAKLKVQSEKLDEKDKKAKKAAPKKETKKSEVKVKVEKKKVESKPKESKKAVKKEKAKK